MLASIVFDSTSLSPHIDSVRGLAPSRTLSISSNDLLSRVRAIGLDACRRSLS